MEWGVGQIIPLKKALSRLAQVGVTGYDQWQVTANQGSTANFPYYSMHAIGLQTNFIAPGKGFSAFFKYLPEYLVKSIDAGSNLRIRLDLDVARSRLAARRTKFGFGITPEMCGVSGRVAVCNPIVSCKYRQFGRMPLRHELRYMSTSWLIVRGHVSV